MISQMLSTQSAEQVVSMQSFRHSRLVDTNVAAINTLVIFDDRVTDLAVLYDALLPGAMGYTLGSDNDGLVAITRLLSETGARKLAIVAHGEPGVVYLGREPIDLAMLSARSGLLQEWCVDEIDLYACEVGANIEFVSQFALVTGAAIFAAKVPVGAGNWDLDVASDDRVMNTVWGMESLVDYAGTLMPTFTEGADNNQGDAVNVFSTATVSTIKADQNIIVLNFTVVGLLDAANETIIIDGTTISLNEDVSGLTINSSLICKVTSTDQGSSAIISISSIEGISATDVQTLLTGITYQNTNIDNPTKGDRTFTITQTQDNGSTVNHSFNNGINTTELQLISTITVESVNDAPVGDSTVNLAKGRENVPYIIKETDLLEGISDSDINSNLAIFNLNANNGTLSDPSGSAGSRQWIFTPANDFNGQVTLTYDVSDGLVSLTNKSTSFFINNDIQVNTYTSDDQYDSAIAALSGGGFIIVWFSYQDGSDKGVYGKRYDSSGIAIGEEFRINSSAVYSQGHPSVAALPSNGFVVTWSAPDRGGILGQRYDGDGLVVGEEFKVGTSSKGYESSLTALPNGGFVVTWISSTENGEIRGQRYGQDGTATGDEFKINTSSGTQQHSSVITLSDGGFLATWHHYSSEQGEEVFGRQYDIAGLVVGEEFKINTSDNGRDSSVMALSNGGFVAVWTSYPYGVENDNHVFSIHGQQYNNRGITVGKEFIVNPDINSEQSDSSIIALADGGFVVNWTAYNRQNEGTEVYGQMYDRNSLLVGSVFKINTYTNGYQENSSTAVLANGSIVVAWNGQSADDYEGVNARVIRLPYAPVLNAITDPNAINESTDRDIAAITGTLSVQDLNIADTLTASIVGSPVIKLNGKDAPDVLIADGVFTFDPAIVVNGQAQTIGYSYNPGAANLNFLRADQFLTATYTIKVNDGSADSANRDITFMINGTNDAPTIEVTAINPNFIKGDSAIQGTAVKVFSEAKVSSIEAGQTITSISFSIDGLKDGVNETIFIDGTSITLNQDAMGISNNNFLDYQVIKTVGGANITLATTKGVAANVIEVLIKGITYQNTNIDNPTEGDRTFAVTQIRDNGGTVRGGFDTSNVSLTSTIKVTAINDAPALTRVVAELPLGIEDTAYTIKKSDLLAGFTDVDNSELSIANVVIDGRILSANASGDYEFNAAKNANGAFKVFYQVSDGTNNTAASLNFTLQSVNDLPTLTGRASSLPSGIENTAYNIRKSDLLAGFTDADNSNLSIVNVVIYGKKLIANTNGDYEFDAGKNVNGTFQISYEVTDGINNTPASLNFSLNAINDAPALTGIAAKLPLGLEDTTYTIKKSDLLAGFTDVDNSELSIANVVIDSKTLSANTNGDYEFNAAKNANGAFKVSYQVSDSTNNTTASLNFTLQAVNDIPTAIVLGNAITTLIEDFDTTNRVKIADINIIDDEAGINILSLSSSNNNSGDADSFEIDGNTLFLKAGNKLNANAKSSFALVLNANDQTIGNIFTNFNLSITPKITLTPASILIPQLAPININSGLFQLSQGTGSATSLLFSKVSHQTTNRNELGVFIVDDSSGTINGVRPDQTGYLDEVLKRSQVVFSALGESASDNILDGLLTRTVNLTSNSKLGFYLVVDGTADDLSAGAKPNILFSFPASVNELKNSQTLQTGGKIQVAFTDTTAATNQDFNDLVVQIETVKASAFGVTQQGSKELYDFTAIASTFTATATFEIKRDAGYNNHVGFYKVEDAFGTIKVGRNLIKPGDPGYLEAALIGRIEGIDLSGANGQVIAGSSSFQGGAIYAPILIANSSTANSDFSNVYTAYSLGNADKVDHVRLLGDNTFGFEDLYGGGDRDFNDVIVKATFTTTA
jgi:VCBS repeat-containing protein